MKTEINKRKKYNDIMRQNTTIINCSKSLFKESIVFIKSI